MIKIKNVTMKNFMSVGAVQQSVDLDKNGITLVLGENLDLGGLGNRNGAGKTTISSAISYGLYGQPLTNIKKDNLINKINQKNMVVSINFEVNNVKYQIERGRKPNYFKYIVNDQQIKEQDSDEAQGENKDTQVEIDRILGISHSLFKQIISLNTYNEPFLDLGASKQREIIEELLGITQLSKKSDNLRELIKITKTDIEREEFRIQTIKSSNEKIQNTIRDFQFKVEKWIVNNLTEIDNIKTAIDQLEKIDIANELKIHSDIEIYKELKTGINQFNKEIFAKKRHVSQLDSQLNNLLTQYTTASNKTCPMCAQGIKDHTHNNILNNLENNIATVDSQLNIEKSDLEKLQEELNTLNAVFDSMQEPIAFYSTLKQALEHKSTLDQLYKDLLKEENAINPYSDQTETLSNTLQEVNYDILNTLVKSREHQEFLLKLLTNKDSFIRKRIIDQNLSYLNSRLEDYLDKLGLPYSVKFLNDLSTEILFLGQDLDFHNLSRGERTRLIIGLSLAFRDIFETTNNAIDLVFIDELLDSGLDAAGFELSIAVLKKMERERGKNIFIISHREELLSRVTSTLSVIKEDGFTRFDYDYIQS